MQIDNYSIDECKERAVCGDKIINCNKCSMLSCVPVKTYSGSNPWLSLNVIIFGNKVFTKAVKLKEDNSRFVGAPNSMTSIFLRKRRERHRDIQKRKITKWKWRQKYEWHSCKSKNIKDFWQPEGRKGNKGSLLEPWEEVWTRCYLDFRLLISKTKTQHEKS